MYHYIIANNEMIHYRSEGISTLWFIQVEIITSTNKSVIYCYIHHLHSHISVCSLMWNKLVSTAHIITQSDINIMMHSLMWNNSFQQINQWYMLTFITFTSFNQIQHKVDCNWHTPFKFWARYELSSMVEKYDVH